MATKIKRLSTDALAKALAAVYAHYEVDQLTGKRVGKVWASYTGGGWIDLRGDNLPSHPDLRSTYPNGWTMLQPFRTSEVRRIVREAAR